MGYINLDGKNCLPKSLLLGDGDYPIIALFFFYLGWVIKDLILFWAQGGA